jgi:hypothetical protein
MRLRGYKTLFFLPLMFAASISAQSPAPPRFLTLPFTNPSVKMQQGWLYTNGQIHSPSGAFDYVDGTIDSSSTWKNFDVVAAADGVAIWDDSPTSGYGNVVVIRHDKTDDQGRHFFTLYAHLKDGTINSAIPKLGRYNTQFQNWARVFAGEVLGQSGATGSQQCAIKIQCIHLHFEVRLGSYGGTSLDPYDISSVSGSKFKRDRYPGGNSFSGCGSAYLWTICPPIGPPSSVIARATLDGSPWPMPGTPGPVSYSIVGPNGVIIGLGVPAQTSGLAPGQYTFFYSSGGPPDSSLTGISPAGVQTLTSGKSISFTLQFSSRGGFTTIPSPTETYRNSTTLIPILGSDFTTVTSLNNSVQTVSFSIPMQVLTVPNGWSTWNSPPFTETNTPRVLYTQGASSVTLTLAQPAALFGFEAEPNPFSVHTITATFMSGSTAIGTIALPINGNAGALLAAASTNQAITSVTISSDVDFAIAQIRSKP